MHIKIYQIDLIKDQGAKIFVGYKRAISMGPIDPLIYKTVYDGTFEDCDLESLFRYFQGNYPIAFVGRSMSVSDIIEIVDADASVSYFCDSSGFVMLENFDSSKVAPIDGKQVVIIEPYKRPYKAIYSVKLPSLQGAVCGLIECTYPFDENVIVISNEEGKLYSLPGNRRINGEIYVGNMLIVGLDENDDFTNLSDEQCERYITKFYEPEIISPDEVEDSIKFEFYAV